MLLSVSGKSDHKHKQQAISSQSISAHANRYIGFCSKQFFHYV
ncbi:MAG: hypothetical protein OFPI_06630 [Osedax symbiont Rs2]|nr:MAG: hypothetical protein OFPI_06630 [Osedax symbiont Rs2]